MSSNARKYMHIYPVDFIQEYLWNVLPTHSLLYPTHSQIHTHPVVLKLSSSVTVSLTSPDWVDLYPLCMFNFSLYFTFLIDMFVMGALVLLLLLVCELLKNRNSGSPEPQALCPELNCS